MGSRQCEEDPVPLLEAWGFKISLFDAVEHWTMDPEIGTGPCLNRSWSSTLHCWWQRWDIPKVLLTHACACCVHGVSAHAEALEGTLAVHTRLVCLTWTGGLAFIDVIRAVVSTRPTRLKLRYGLVIIMMSL